VRSVKARIFILENWEAFESDSRGFISYGRYCAFMKAN
jgi:hypothetical protein